MSLPIKYLVNCMGPQMTMDGRSSSLVRQLIDRGLAQLDELQLGFAVNQVGAIRTASGDYSNYLFTVGPMRKGERWECSAVPEIRKQCAELANHLLS